MELEAVRNALKAVKDMKAPPTIIVATDSMAILCKIKSGYLSQDTEDESGYLSQDTEDEFCISRNYISVWNAGKLAVRRE